MIFVSAFSSHLHGEGEYVNIQYGHELITRYTFGSVVDEIYDSHISDIPIPLPSKQVMNIIGNPVLEANQKINTAYNLEQRIICKVELQIKKIGNGRS